MKLRGGDTCEPRHSADVGSANVLEDASRQGQASQREIADLIDASSSSSE